MADVIISVIQAGAFKIKADRWRDEELDIDYLDIEATPMSNVALGNINIETAVNTFIEGEDCGYYTLIVKDAERYVLAKGEIEKLRKL
ncbi:hypothetical protein [Pantoea agglomerans]|uniref:hypothetical protein n=1 Tax=Enterobacter agglomerans TaxID=549 RepID=UPI0021D7BDEE|nr:hypothetical protein [Pantoea agglomerans]